MPDEQKPERNEVRIGSDSAPTFYANNVNVMVTPWDMRLLFSQILKADESGATYKDVASIYLSPGQALALKRVLDIHMAKYQALWAQQDAMIKSLEEEPKAN